MGNRDIIAGLEFRNIRSNSINDTRYLVTENGSFLHGLVNRLVYVGPTDANSICLDQDFIVAYLWNRTILDLE